MKAFSQSSNNPMHHFLCGMFIKDHKGIYTWVSDELLKLQGLAPHEILGKTDHKLPWSHHQNRLRLHDQEVLDKKISITFHEIIHRRGRDIEGYCHKSPVFRRDGQITGVAGIFFDAPQPNESVAIKLSVREKQCLLNLAKGMNAQESAKTLSLSPRTVEDYLEKLRHKLHCKNQAGLLSFYYKNIELVS